MNWNFDRLRLLYALNFALGMTAIYGPLAVAVGRPGAIPWLASMGFMIGWLMGPFL